MAAQQFKERVLQQFFQDIHNREQDNYSWHRFSYDGVDRSALFEGEKHARYLDWFMTNCELIYAAFSRLADEASKDLYINLLRFKLAGHLHVRIRSSLLARGTEVARFQAVFAGSPSQLKISGMFGTLFHYDAEWNSVRYKVDTLKDALMINLVYRQYYYNRGGVVIEPIRGDHVIDGGACTGDTAAIFRGSVGSTGRVYAFDPVKNHIDICEYNFSRSGYENVVVMPYGLSDKSVDAPTVQLREYFPGYRPGPADAPIPLRRIDDLVIDGTIDRIDYIKMDVEGSEMAALRGAISSIHRYRPKLAISLYHKPNDFFEIINFIHELQLGYKLYLDHYTIHDEETLVYAIVG